MPRADGSDSLSSGVGAICAVCAPRPGHRRPERAGQLSFETRPRQKQDGWSWTAWAAICGSARWCSHLLRRQGQAPSARAVSDAATGLGTRPVRRGSTHEARRPARHLPGHGPRAERSPAGSRHTRAVVPWCSQGNRRMSPDGGRSHPGVIHSAGATWGS